MVHDSQQVLVACHGDNSCALAQYLLLDAPVSEHTYVAEIGEAAAPASAQRETLDGLPVLKAIVPSLSLFPLVERPELNI